MSDDIYEVYALAYARVDRRSPDNFLGGDPHDVPMPLAYYVWLIVGATAGPSSSTPASTSAAPICASARSRCRSARRCATSASTSPRSRT